MCFLLSDLKHTPTIYWQLYAYNFSANSRLEISYRMNIKIYYEILQETVYISNEQLIPKQMTDTHQRAKYNTSNVRSSMLYEHVR